MARIVLIVGVQPGPAGKTGLMMALWWGMREAGIPALPLKPYASVNWYRDYGLYMEWRAKGAPFSREALLFKEAGCRLRFYEVNPVCNVETPLRPEYFLEAGAPGQLFAYSADPGRSSVATRVTLMGGGAVNYGFINGKLVQRGVSLLGREEVAKITSSLDRVETIWGFEDYSEAVAANAAMAIARAVEELSSRGFALLVEGFSDAAFVPGISQDVHLVLAVYPGSVIVYEPSRYMAAIVVRSHVGGGGVARFRDVASLVRPRGVYRLAPLSAGMLPEDIYRRNRGVVEKIVSELE